MTKDEILALMVELAQRGDLNPVEVVKYETTGVLTKQTKQALGLVSFEVPKDFDPAPRAKGRMIRKKKGEW